MRALTSPGQHTTHERLNPRAGVLRWASHSISPAHQPDISRTPRPPEHLPSSPSTPRLRGSLGGSLRRGSFGFYRNVIGRSKGHVKISLRRESDATGSLVLLPDLLSERLDCQWIGLAMPLSCKCSSIQLATAAHVGAGSPDPGLRHVSLQMWGLWPAGDVHLCAMQRIR